MANDTLTTITQPPSFQLPYLKTGLRTAENLLLNPPEVYTGPGVAPLSAATQAAYAQAGQGGQTYEDLMGLSRTAQAGFQSALNTDVASNPEFQALVSSLQNKVNTNLTENILPGIATTSAGLGAFGGSDAALLQSRGIADTQEALTSGIANLGGQFFSTMSAARNNALSNLPGLVSTIQSPLQTLAASGSAQDVRRQTELQDTIDTFNRVQQAPEQALDRFINRVSGNLGSSQVQEQSGGRSALGAGLLGGLGGFLAGQGLGLGTGGSLLTGLIGGLGSIF